jgi:hypothetical protein
MPVTRVFPTGDITTEWDTLVPTSPTTHYTKLDEGSPATDADYIETTTLTDVFECTLGDTPGNTDTVTQVAVNIKARITDSGGNAYIRLTLWDTTVSPNVVVSDVGVSPDEAYKDVTTTDLGGSGVLAKVTKTWTGLTLTKAQADGLQLRAVFDNA